jgi:hypothetical protein
VIDMSERESFRGKIYREQLITVEDLESFKLELLTELRALIKGSGIQPMKKWLKTGDVRKILGMSIGTLQTLRINGTLPFTKIGGVLYYDYEDIQNMLLSRKHINR